MEEPEMKVLTIALALASQVACGVNLPKHEREVVMIRTTGEIFLATGFYLGNDKIVTNNHVVHYNIPNKAKPTLRKWVLVEDRKTTLIPA